MSSRNPDVAPRRRHPSTWRGRDVRFAHPSEAVFAGLLDLYGVEWEYEPVEFALAWSTDGTTTRGFRPDFFLPAERTFVELTVLEQRLVTKKNRKIREFRSLYPEVALQVVYQRDFLDLVARHAVPFSHPRAA